MWLLFVDFLCRAILTLCHWLYSLKLRLKFIKMMVANWWYEAGYLLSDKTAKENFEIKYVEDKTKQFSKIPVHLCLALGEDDTSYEQLSNLIAWSSAAGVSILSFYDHKNELNANVLHKSFRTMYPSLMRYIKWAVSFDNQHDAEDIQRNSATSSLAPIHSMQVNVLDSQFGRQLLLDSLKELCMKSSADGVSLPQDRASTEMALDAIMRDKLCGSSNPDFLLISGNAYTTYGLSPWHIGFTEFLTTPSYKLLKVTDYIKILQTYAKCEQKFGR